MRKVLRHCAESHGQGAGRRYLFFIYIYKKREGTGERCPQTLGIRGFEPFQWYGTVMERTGTVGKITSCL